MLIEKSQKLIELSQETIDLQKYLKNVEGFKSRQKQIAQLVITVKPIVSALKAFRQRNLFNFDITQKADQLLSYITKIEENFHNDPEWIIDNTNFKESYLRSSVDALLNPLKREILISWKQYLDRRLPSTNQEVLNLLSRVDAFKLTVQKIKNIHVRISQDKFPQSCEEFDNIEKLIDQLKEHWDSLSAGEVPESVLIFLRSAANEGASLTLLTPEVHDWLNHHQISNSLRIRLS